MASKKFSHTPFLAVLKTVENAHVFILIVTVIIAAAVVVVVCVLIINVINKRRDYKILEYFFEKI